MKRLHEVRSLLDEINTAIAGYDPVLKEKARDLLLEVAFGRQAPRRSTAAETPFAASDAPEARDRLRALVPDRRELTFAALWQSWAPSRASEKALLGAYFLQEIRGQSPITSQHINTVLKRHGLHVSNITRAVETNLNADPPLIVQVRKLGTTRQARKLYRVTADGLHVVQQHISPLDAHPD